MAKVPVYNVPTVSPENISDIRGYANAQTFGAGVGQAVSGLGQSVSQVGDMLAANALKLQEQTNQADVDTAFVSWLPAQGELDTKLNSLQGKAREEYFPEYVRQTEETRRKFHDSLSNPDAKRRFNSETRRYAAYSIRNGAAAVATGLRQHATQANTALIESGGLTVQANPTSPSAFDMGLESAFKGIQQQGDLANTPQDQIDLQKRIKKSELRGLQIAAIADENPELAVQLEEQHRSDLVIKADRDKVSAAINIGRNKRGSRAEVMKQQNLEEKNQNLTRAMKTGTYDPTMGRKVRIHQGVGEEIKYDQELNDALIIHKNTENIFTQTPESMATTLRDIKPRDPAANDYNRAMERYDKIKKMQEAVLKLRVIDPALSVSEAPLVAEAERVFNPEDPASFPVVGAVRLAAQAQAGIPENQRSPARLSEVAPVMAPLKFVPPGTAGKAVAEVAKELQKRFGDASLRILGQAIEGDRYSVPVKEEVARYIAAEEARRVKPPTKPSPQTIIPPKQQKTIDEVQKNDPPASSSLVPSAAPVFNPSTDVAPTIDEFGNRYPPAAEDPPSLPKPHSKRVLEKWGTIK